MRLLTLDENENLYFVENPKGHDGKAAPYAILSHTWLEKEKGEDVEVNFEDIQCRTENIKKQLSYKKIKFAVKKACEDKLQYCWVDTCCINKADPVEEVLAIRSMFEWYRLSTKCYVYLADVTNMTLNDQKRAEIRKSKWFTRGWTLQELLAPGCVEFFSNEGRLLGTKHDLQDLIKDVTKIPTDAICGKKPLRDFSVAQKLNWRAGRETTEKQDRAYCLLGIFEVDIEMIPGGEHTAFARLLDAIYRKDDASRHVDTLTHDPSLWSFEDSVPLREMALQNRPREQNPLFTKTQAELQKNIKLANFLATHYRFSTAEQLFLLTLTNAEEAAEQLRGSISTPDLDSDIKIASYVDFLLRRVGNMYYQQRELLKAKETYNRALRQANGGEINQRSTYETHSNLGAVFAEIGELAEAMKHTELAVAGRKLAKDDSDDTRIEYVRSLNNLATLHQDQGDSCMALDAYDEALAIVRATLEPWKFGLEELEIQINLGRLYMKEGEAQKAKEAFYKATLAWVNKATKGELDGEGDFSLTQVQASHPGYLTAIEGMGKACCKLGQDAEAYRYFVKAFEGHKTAGHIRICGAAKSLATFSVNRGCFRYGLERINEAKKVLRKDLPSNEQSLREMESFYDEIKDHMDKEMQKREHENGVVSTMIYGLSSLKKLFLG